MAERGQAGVLLLAETKHRDASGRVLELASKLATEVDCSGNCVIYIMNRQLREEPQLRGHGGGGRGDQQPRPHLYHSVAVPWHCRVPKEDVTGNDDFRLFLAAKSS